MDEGRGHRHVVGHDVIDGYRVSTRFMGINMDHFGLALPLFFETLVRLPNGKVGFEHHARYSTWVEANEGHISLVSKLKTL